MKITGKISLVLSMVFVGILISTHTVHASSSNDSLVGYWKFDEMPGNMLDDSSGDGLSGTIQGNPLSSTEVPDLNFTNERSLSFDGNDYVSIESGTPESVLGSNPKTVSMWIYPTSIERIGFFFMGPPTGSAGQGTTFRFSTDVKYTYNPELDDFDEEHGFLDVDVSNGTDTSDLKIQVETWQHIAVVYAGGTNWKVCLDAVCENLSLPQNNLLDGLMYIGRGNWSSIYMQGNIDDVRLYSRALSDTEISALAAGNHTSATWNGSSSTDYETADNWDIGAVPDPYTHAIIADVENDPSLTEDIYLASLTINEGAILTTNCFGVGFYDGGGLSGDGILDDFGCGVVDSQEFSSESSETSAPSAPTAPAPSVPTCVDLPPGDTPDLFQIDVNNTQATLYFVPVRDANKYFISYGEGERTEKHGIEFQTGESTGVLAFTINHLAPNTEYSFKVRGGNGCMPGEWGNTMTVKTGNSTNSGTSFYKNFVSRILAVFPRRVTSAGSDNDVMGTATAAEKSCQDYVVQPGDNLWNIAFYNLGSGPRYPEIMQANNLTSTLLKIGQTLKVGC